MCATKEPRAVYLATFLVLVYMYVCIYVCVCVYGTCLDVTVLLKMCVGRERKAQCSNSASLHIVCLSFFHYPSVHLPSVCPTVQKPELRDDPHYQAINSTKLIFLAI